LVNHLANGQRLSRQAPAKFLLNPAQVFHATDNRINPSLIP
jgi:hypothetical protein